MQIPLKMFYNYIVMYMKKYVTDIKNNKYFNEEELSKIRVIDEKITIDFDNTYTFFSGIGGALTQSSNYNYELLDKYNKNKLIMAYFKELQYKYIRLPIGSCDFSPYSYNYYKFFGINMKEDEKNIHPLLNDIKEFKISYMASPWSPPKRWKLPLINKLRWTCYKRYAKYLVNYLKYYKEYGINIDFISIQNEPYAYQKWESCIWTKLGQKIFIKYFLIPLLKKNDLDTSIMLHDHNKKNLSKKIKKTFIDDKYVGAIAFHWYDGSYFDELNEVHNKYPQLLLIESEMCCGYSPYDELEWVHDAELYADEIIGNINNGMNIYVDWNLLLDMNGGPNHKQNYVKAPILRNEIEIIKTPIYHYLKHISIHQEQLVIKTEYNNLKVLCTKRNNDYLLTILNDSDKKIRFSINNDIKDSINAHSINSYIIKS